jgi:TolB-like protein
MFADMVGYSALMQGDERSAYRARKRYRRALETATARFGGEVIQHYGDGSLTLFRSAVNAARAAVQMQRALRLEEEVPVRIGIHMADVVRNADGVYGTGVNVAARIEAMGRPGSVMVSGRVAAELSSHPHLAARDLGEYRLKNIADPVRLFALVDRALVVPTRAELMPLQTAPAPVGAPALKDTGATSVGAEAPLPVAGTRLGRTVAGFLYELHRRRVLRVVVGYVVAVVGLLQVLEYAAPGLGLPDWMVRAGLALGLLGLPITVKLAWVYDVTPRGIVRTGRAPGPVGRLEPALAVLLLGSCLALAGAISAAPGSVDRSSPVDRVASDAHSLAVLPLEPIGVDDDRFTEGLHESLLTRLAGASTMPVLSHASVAAYHDPTADRTRVDEELGASLVLEGCVQRTGNTVIVQVRLVDPERGRTMWSAEFDGDYTPEGALDLQTRIAARVADMLATGPEPRDVPEVTHSVLSVGT